jgi:hypothetical protein
MGLKVGRKQPHADSPEFDHENLSARSAVVVFDTEAQAAAAVVLFEGNDVTSCLNQARTKLVAASASAGGSAKVGTPTAGEQPVAPVGDSTVAYRVVIPVTVRSLTLNTYNDFEIVRVGRTLASFIFTSTVTPFPELSTSLIHAVVGRLKAGPS